MSPSPRPHAQWWKMDEETGRGAPPGRGDRSFILLFPDWEIWETGCHNSPLSAEYIFPELWKTVIINVSEKKRVFFPPRYYSSVLIPWTLNVARGWDKPQKIQGQTKHKSLNYVGRAEEINSTWSCIQPTSLTLMLCECFLIFFSSFS